MLLRLLLPGIVLFTAAAPAAASSSRWQESEGGAIRLVTAGTADADGVLKGALQISLDPGWKTYWRDPGQAGVPPSLDISKSANIESADLFFPAPRRIDDGYAQSAGYARPVTLPVTFKLSDPGAPARIEAQIFLGICKTICIPVKADLTVEPAANPRDTEDVAVVEAGFAALPAEPADGFRVDTARIEGDSLVVEAKVPDSTGDSALFVASGDGFLFDLPEQESRDGSSVTFSARILEKPEEAVSPSPRFDYTLTADQRAVSGKLSFR